MIDELKTVYWVVLDRTGNSGGWEDLVRNEHRVFSRVFRFVTVKTSLLIQRCKTIFRNASATKFNF
jgi:hypothetical protein